MKDLDNKPHYYWKYLLFCHQLKNDRCFHWTLQRWQMSTTYVLCYLKITAVMRLSDPWLELAINTLIKRHTYQTTQPKFSKNMMTIVFQNSFLCMYIIIYLKILFTYAVIKTTDNWYAQSHDYTLKHYKEGKKLHPKDHSMKLTTVYGGRNQEWLPPG